LFDKKEKRGKYNIVYALATL